MGDLMATFRFFSEGFHGCRGRAGGEDGLGAAPLSWFDMNEIELTAGLVLVLIRLALPLCIRIAPRLATVLK